MVRDVRTNLICHYNTGNSCRPGVERVVPPTATVRGYFPITNMPNLFKHLLPLATIAAKTQGLRLTRSLTGWSTCTPTEARRRRVTVPQCWREGHKLCAKYQMRILLNCLLKACKHFELGR